MCARSIAVTLSILLALAGPLSADPHPGPRAQLFKLVWLVANNDGLPLAAVVFPRPMSLAMCTIHAQADEDRNYSAYEQVIGEYVADQLGVDIESLAPATPLCLTPEEAAKLARDVREQPDLRGEHA